MFSDEEFLLRNKILTVYYKVTYVIKTGHTLYLSGGRVRGVWGEDWVRVVFKEALPFEPTAGCSENIPLRPVAVLLLPQVQCCKIVIHCRIIWPLNINIPPFL